MAPRVFLAGATGYVGSALVPRLLAAGCRVTVLARPESARRVPGGADAVFGNALDSSSFVTNGASTYIHLVGTPHPAPWKGAAFRAVDLQSLKASLKAALRGNIDHFLYVSVAHPAPVMRDYIAVRMECEQRIADSGLRATFLRPWYVLGPGHRWPVVLRPLYALAGLTRWRRTAERLGLVTLEEMVAALEWAVRHPPARGSPRAIEVAEIRALAAGRNDVRM